MKWYHFSLIFLICFCGIFLEEQKDELTTRLRENERRMEYDCLVAAVNAATEKFFSEEGKAAKEICLKNTETVFFRTLAVLHEKNTDETGMDTMRGRTPFLAVFGEEGIYIYQRKQDAGYVWSFYEYTAGERIPEQFFADAGQAVGEYLKTRGVYREAPVLLQSFAGIWEKELEKGCVFAAYVPEEIQLSQKERVGLLYAAARKVEEHYYVTNDMRCHLPSCVQLRNETIVSVFGTQKEAAKNGAVPCKECLLWENN